MRPFLLYLLGIVVPTAGLACAAWLLYAPPPWIGAWVIIGIRAGHPDAVKRTQRRDPPRSAGTSRPGP